MGRNVYAVIFKDRSSTADGTPATSKQVAPANPGRQYFFYQNISDTAETWINFGAAAAADTVGSIYVGPKGTYESSGNIVSQQAVNMVSDTASSKFTAKEA